LHTDGAIAQAQRPDTPAFLAHGGEMGRRIREFDWSKTPLGAPAQWHASLRMAARVLLTTNHPVFVFWGDDATCLYNDAYRKSLGPEKRDAILGAPAREAWPEIWHIVGPQIAQVMRGDGATWHENALVPILRNGRIDEVYWTYSYSPIDDEHAASGVGGVLVLCTETTRSVLAASYDITDRRQLETELRSASTRLEAMMSAAEIGLWIWDLRRDRVEVDRNLRSLYGFGPDEGDLPDQHFSRLHPEDRPAVQTAIAIALQTGTLYIREYRIQLPDGRVRWFAGRGTLQRDDDGAPAMLTGLVIDIGDLKALEESLKASDRRKDEFLAILAHELRNPLAPIRSAARILTTENLGAAELTWCRDVIQRQVQHMAHLLDDLLDVSRITQQRLRLEKEVVDLATVVSSAVEAARPAIDAHRHRLSVSLPTEPIIVEVDPGRLSQVLSNLLDNAAKYTDVGGEIALEAGRVGDAVQVTVSDTGVGMASADLGRAFEMFTQVRSPLDRSQGGLGIGLALVRGLVELHGGRVHADSPGRGRGSTFTVTLPDHPSPRAAVPDAASDAGPPAARRRILVADDNRDAADSLAMLLELQGHETRVAYDGREALSAFAAFQPEIVLLDIGMPELNGYEVAERIRREPGGDAVVLAALTGWGQQQDKRQAKAAGFDHHFAKPVDPDLLIATLQHSPSRR